MTSPSLEHLSAEDKSKYEDNVEHLQSLQQDLKRKQEKYKNDAKMYDRFIPNILSCIEDLETQNKNILEAKVRSVFTIHSKLQFHKSIRNHSSS